ncbi:MAG: rhodanese-like domain-containing protein [Pseudobdellovibrio sp.]
MLNKLVLFAFAIIVAACQQAPTRFEEQTVNTYNKNVVLVDTRPAFEFATYHVPGSVNLNSSDYLILKNAKTKKRVLDPDLAQTVERLARRGISPLKSIVLLADKSNSEENKKWNWLLMQLGVQDVVMLPIDNYKKMNKNLVPQAGAQAAPVWTVQNQKLILQKADLCFVTWSDANCL